MVVYYRCKACDGEHPSPIAFGSKESFETAHLSGNVFQCPATEKCASYDKVDMFWKDEAKK